MISLIVLVPLLMAVLTCLGAAIYSMKRKAQAQAICVHELATLQNNLKTPLLKLLRMNPRAEALRLKREHADEALEQALASAIPPVIAAAEAYQTAIILEQTEFAAAQLRLLTEADRLREESQRRLPQRVRSLDAVNVHNDRAYFRPLAVEPKPPFSLSPNYEKVAFFVQAQQQRVHFEADLRGDFPIPRELSGEWRQSTECAVSLEEGLGGAWDIRILKAKAL